MAHGTVGPVPSPAVDTAGGRTGEPAPALGFVLTAHVSVTTFGHESLDTSCLHERNFWQGYHWAKV